MLNPEEIVKLNQDWISIFFFLSFIIISFLRNLDKKKFDLLILLSNTEKYYSVYGKEKTNYHINLFSLLKILVILIVKSLFVTFIIDNSSSYKTFQSIFLIILATIIFRHFLLKNIFKLLNLDNLLSETVFKSISSYFRISLLSLPLLLLHSYTFVGNSTFLFICSSVIIFTILYTHITIYLKVLSHDGASIFYIILYLCAFKITPWLWLYAYLKPWGV